MLYVASMFLCAMVDVGGGQNIRLLNVLLWLCIVGEGLVSSVQAPNIHLAMANKQWASNEG